MKLMAFRLSHFPRWWYWESPWRWGQLTKNLVEFLDNKLAVSLMIRLLLVPLFHDTSLLGRILSLIFRLSRMIIGLTVICLALMALGFWFLIWLIFPIGLVVYLADIGWLIILIFWLLDVLHQMSLPLVITDRSRPGPNQIIYYLDKQARAFVKQAQGDTNALKNLLMGSKQIRLFLARVEILSQNLDAIRLLPIWQDWLSLAFQEAQQLKSAHVGRLHFILALLKQEGFRYQEALATVAWMEQQSFWEKTPFIWDKEFRQRPIGGVDRGWTGIPTPNLDKFSTDLTARAQKAQLPEIIAKQKQVEQIIKILSRSQQNNVLISGQPGCGKTTLVKGLAQEIVRGVRSSSLKFKRLVSLDTARLAAGANSAELNQRITKIIEEITASENIILFIDEVHNLATLNQDLPETSDIFMALEPPLSEGKFQFIGATNTKNIKKYIEPNEAFVRLFEVVELPEATKPQTKAILEYLAWKLEQKEKVIITSMALGTIIELAGRLIHDRVFPDKGVNLLDEVVASITTKGEQLVTSAEVQRLVAEKTKVPVTELTKKETELLLKLEEKLHQRVIGQNQAIKAVADALRRARTGIKDPNKPIASFMFAGPTGVGKTETAKTLAEEFFGSEKIMIRLDMSEYQTLDDLSRLIGPPPGKLAVSPGGQLTEAVRHQPFTVVLLDEVEKAHKKILNLFLQVLDDARLTDSQGKVVDFSNTIIIATTNIGTSTIIEAIKKKKSPSQLTQEALQALESHYPPEFLNRFSGLIVFQALNRKEVEAVVKLKLNLLIQNLKKKGLEVSFTADLVEALAKLGFSPKWGGRHIQRTIQEKVENVIAQQILKGKIKKSQPVKLSASILTHE